MGGECKDAWHAGSRGCTAISSSCGSDCSGMDVPPHPLPSPEPEIHTLIHICTSLFLTLNRHSGGLCKPKCSCKQLCPSPPHPILKQVSNLEILVEILEANSSAPGPGGTQRQAGEQEDQREEEHEWSHPIEDARGAAAQEQVRQSHTRTPYHNRTRRMPVPSGPLLQRLRLLRSAWTSLRDCHLPANTHPLPPCTP